MTIAPEVVTLAGSGIVFSNIYSAGVTEAYRTAIITAENELQSHFTNAVVVSLNFEIQPGENAFAARNEYAVVPVSYAQFVAALTAHASTASDLSSLAGLPTTDPSHGIGFWVPGAEARILGLSDQGEAVDDTVTLNGDLPFNFSNDAIGLLEHEISEGVFGRVSSLGIAHAGWEPMDLFRYDAQGEHDFTGGADGKPAFFGVDGGHVTSLQFHSSVNAAGVFDGFDLADWTHASGDAFGPNGAGIDNAMSAIDLQVLDLLGWTPTGSQAAATSVASLVDGSVLSVDAISTPLIGTPGADTINGSAITDYLRGGEGDDSISGGSAFDDINGNQGDDTADGNAGDDWVVGGKGDDMLSGDVGGDVVWGNLGNDTLAGGDGTDQMRGGQGDDVLNGGAGTDYVSGDRGNDTITGGAGDDLFHTSQDAGTDRVLDFDSGEGDRVMLDLGTTYLLYQIGADTIVDTGNGNEMVLVGVQLSSLPPGWIFEA